MTVAESRYFSTLLSVPRLRPAITSALIAPMRAAKLISTTLLVLQLFVATGMWGGACCATGPHRTDHNHSAVNESYEPAAEEKIEAGHCPLHAAKKARPRSQERQWSKASQRSASTHHRSHQTRSSSTSNAHLCACVVKREELLFDALPQRPPEQRPLVKNLHAPLSLTHWLIKAPPSQMTAPDPFRSHSPPFRGSQLRLRI
jgi:hypothetical protein